MALIFVLVVASSFTAALAAPQERLPNLPEPPAPHSPEEEFAARKPSTDERTLWEIFNVTDPGPEFWEQRRAITSNFTYGSYLHNDISNPEDLERQGWMNPQTRWPGGIIPVYIDPYWNNEQRAIMVRGLEKITSTTCIRFEDYNRFNPRHSNFVIVNPMNPGNGCNANVGRATSPGYQTVNLSVEEGCVNEGTVAHEFIHTIGFWHEQQRPDRDDWITINYENIPSNRWSDFNEIPGLRTFGTTYDYGSIMHYPAYLPWAIDPNVPIFFSKTRTEVQGQEKEMTRLDIQKIQNMYRGICN